MNSRRPRKAIIRPSSRKGYWPNDSTVVPACPLGKKDAKPPTLTLLRALTVSASLAFQLTTGSKNSAFARRNINSFNLRG